jgi:hypothetical protein
MPINQGTHRHGPNRRHTVSPRPTPPETITTDRHAAPGHDPVPAAASQTVPVWCP